MLGEEHGVEKTDVLRSHARSTDGRRFASPSKPISESAVAAAHKTFASALCCSAPDPRDCKSRYHEIPRPQNSRRANSADSRACGNTDRDSAQ